MVDHHELRRDKKGKVRVIARKIRMTRMKCVKVHFKGCPGQLSNQMAALAIGSDRQFFFYPFKKCENYF